MVEGKGENYLRGFAVVLMGTALCVAQPVSAQMDPLKEVAVVHFRQRGS
jgi:hypothetical protein